MPDGKSESVTHRTKSANLHIRLTPENAQKLKEASRVLGISVSEFVARNADFVLDHVTVVHRHYDVDELRADRVQLARLGTNVNQILHSLNAYGLDDERVDLGQLTLLCIDVLSVLQVCQEHIEDFISDGEVVSDDDA